MEATKYIKLDLEMGIIEKDILANWSESTGT